MPLWRGGSTPSAGTIIAINNFLEMDYLKINKKIWERLSEDGQRIWSRRCSKERIEKAKSGNIELYLTPNKIMPKNWFPKKWKGLNVLGLGAGGGQQMPLISAAGATVTSLDLSEQQLKRDLKVCEEEKLSIKTHQGEIEDLSDFSDEKFDLVINAVSSCYTKNVKQVYKEAYRVLRSGGIFITAFMNPVWYALDKDPYYKNEELKLIYPIPWSSVDHFSKEGIDSAIKRDEPLEWGHSLSDLIAGQIESGFVITGFYEDYNGENYYNREKEDLLDSILPQYIVTRAIKLDKRIL